jgi:ubiquinone/menaquinone biosynthesis C-methylase UbiE
MHDNHTTPAIPSMKLRDHIGHYTADAELFDYFEARSGADRDSTERIQQAVFHAAALSTQDQVLDVGSGNGWLALACARKSLPKPVLVDLGIMNLRKISAAYGNIAHAVVADAARLPFRDGAFTCVVISEVLEHMNDPVTGLREARRVLGNTGRCIASTPYKEKIRSSLCIHCNQVTPVNAHLHSFDERRHQQLFSQAGFTATKHTLLVNKLLMYSRVSLLLSFLPYHLWRMVDAFCNLCIRRSATIRIHARRRMD